MDVRTAPLAQATQRQRGSAWRVLPNYLFVLPYLVFFAVFSAGPLVYTIYMSFYNRGLFDTHPPFIGTGNYTALWSDPVWLISLGNTVEFVIVSVIFITLVALGAALLLRALPRWQTFFRTIFFAPAVLSVGIFAIIWNWLFATDSGALNFLLNLVGIGKVPWISDPHIVIPSLAGATVWWNFGFPMIVFLAGLLNIPAPLYEAAAIDGANAWQRFTAITLPLLRPTILFVLVTQVIAQFQVFGQPAFITQGGPGDSSRTILMYLYEVVWRHFQYGYGAALAVTLALIMALITAIQFGVLGRRQEGL
jgi:multiple sugar transport system permease protein